MNYFLKLYHKNFLEYGIPSSADSPEITVVLDKEHPSKLNPLGLRGCGEGGITGSYAAIANAVANALDNPDLVTHLPIRPESIAQVSRID